MTIKIDKPLSAGLVAMIVVAFTYLGCRGHGAILATSRATSGATPRATPTAAPAAKAVSRPVSDGDSDGIPNEKDLCPTRPEDYDGDQDHDGCPEVDPPVKCFDENGRPCLHG